ncbi:MAG TPA: outer membrane lipoprotein-sorting protein [Chthoniobacterales bacterium]|jgi:outer membrane lipoprotein-sorting protein|nr:outer membrane lipoprotein-sorting protein [Chthoniobacterales bacterium]
MNRHFVRTHIFAAICLALPQFTFADEAGSQLATKLRAKETGSTFVRIRMQGGSGNQTLQVQIKSRVSDAASDIVYQILFPKERKGESVLMHRSGSKFTATLFNPPDTLKQIGASEMKQALFGTALSYEDIIDSPFAWSQQAIVGTQDIDRFPCQILESKPGKDHASSYASVKTWVDSKRMVPLQIEKYDSSGKVVRRINITRMLLDGGDSLPADLEVSGPSGSVTRITGSSIKRGQNFPETEFTADGLKALKTPAE